jgi:NAD(P)-dependent dehydrogenase (short-subunit alcohol dehydrogenase family)
MTKTIIITGATSGIGKALALHLAKAGHKIIAVGRNEAALAELHQANPDQIIPVAADLSKYADLTKINDALSHDVKGIYLVHNAGVAVPGLLKDMTKESWDQHIGVNITAPVFLTKLLLPHLKNGGRVLNISTGLAHSPMPGFSAYGISKAALYMMKEFFNAELRDQGIIFGSAMPGVVNTPMQEKIRSTSASQFPSVVFFEGLKERNELIDPETSAKFLAWLLLETRDEDFSKEDWRIDMGDHQKYWADDNNTLN